MNMEDLNHSGLINVESSCYINSILQILYSHWIMYLLMFFLKFGIQQQINFNFISAICQKLKRSTTKYIERYIIEIDKKFDLRIINTAMTRCLFRSESMILSVLWRNTFTTWKFHHLIWQLDHNVLVLRQNVKDWHRHFIIWKRIITYTLHFREFCFLTDWVWI